ncbi:MAG: O-antigen ligase family protein [Acidobacteriota bacterium]
MIFLPLPFGSVDEWAIFAFEITTGILFILYLSTLWRSPIKKQEKRGQATFLISFSRKEANDSLSSQKKWDVSLIFKIFLIIFIVVSVIQVIPLPQFILKILSKNSFRIYEGVFSGGLVGSEKMGWKTISLSPAFSFYELIKYLSYFLFAFLVSRCIRTKKQIEIFVLVMIIAAIFQSFYGLTEFFGGTERIFGYKRKWHVGSATGTFINRNHFSGFLEMIFPISVGYLLAKADFFVMEKGLSLREKILWFSQDRLQKSIILGLISVLIGIAIFFSRSRTGIFIFFITIFLMIIAISIGGRNSSEKLSREKRFRKIVRVIFLTVLFSVILIGIKPIIERFSWESVAGEGRPIIFKNTIDMIKDFPLFGAGPGTYMYAYTMYEKIYVNGITDHAHNDYLELLAESGLIGGGSLILFAFGAVGYFFMKWVKRRDYFIKGVILGCILGIVAILIHSITDFNLRIPANAVYFITLYALSIRMVNIAYGKNKIRTRNVKWEM